jgi:hypothetical protein
MLRVNTIINQVDKEKIIFSFRHFHADWLRTGVRQTKSRGRETVHIVAYSMYMRICIQSVISFSFFYNQTDRCRETDIDILLERICYVKKQSAEKGYLWHSVCVCVCALFRKDDHLILRVRLFDCKQIPKWKWRTKCWSLQKNSLSNISCSLFL